MSDHRVPAPAPPRRVTAAALLGALSALAAPGLGASAESSAPAAPDAESPQDPTPALVTSAQPPPTRGEPAALGRGSLVGIASAIAGRVAGKATPIVPARGKWAHQPTLESSLLTEINRVRRARRIPALAATPILQRPARGHARYLAVARGGKLTHTDARGRPFHRRLVEAGWRARARMSENLAAINACRLKDPRLIVNSWLGSPAHRANLLDRKVTHTGIGVVSSAGCGMTVYAADFGN